MGRASRDMEGLEAAAAVPRLDGIDSKPKTGSISGIY